MVLLSPPEEKYIQQVAASVQQRGLGGPVAFALQAGQPLLLIASQLLWIAQPALSLLWSSGQVSQLARLLEKPGATDLLLAYLDENG